MKRSVGILPITYTEIQKDNFGNVWETTNQIGIVETNDILELRMKMMEMWEEIRK